MSATSRILGGAIILPDSTTLVDYLLNKTTNLIDTLLVYPKRMLRNLESTGGLVFSGQLLLDLVEAVSCARTRIGWCNRTPCARGRTN